MKREWLPVPGYPRYSVSNFGEVKSQGYGLLKPTKIRTGYLVVSVTRERGKQFLIDVHTLVLIAFVGPCPVGLQCRHLDGNPGNNNLLNLCWGTPQQNADDRSAHGRQIKGVDCHSAKLNDETVLKIRQEYAAGGIKQSELADKYKVHSHCIYLLLKGKTWKHVEMPYESTDFSNRRGNGFKRG